MTPAERALLLAVADALLAQLRVADPRVGRLVAARQMVAEEPPATEAGQDSGEAPQPPSDATAGSTGQSAA